MTKEEKRLWYDFLKRLPYTINRQKVIGDYIVDFYCCAAKLVIEVDGAQHYTLEGRNRDAERDFFLYEHGFDVVHYSDHDVRTNFDGVCLDIRRRIGERRENERH